MKKILVFLCAMLLGFGVLGTTQAGAISMQPEGLPLCSGSWEQEWTITDEINKIEVFIISGNTDLGDPPFNNWPISSGWGSSLENPDYGVAIGPLTTGITFTTVFTAPKYETFTIAGLIYNDETLIGGFSQMWDGDAWSEQSLTSINSPEGFNRNAQFPVPEPATMLLLGSGLIGLAALGRKKFYKK